jgi:hypothetical protein
MKFEVTIAANPVFPYYMQHRMDDAKLSDWEKNRGKILERPEASKEDSVRAEYHAYGEDGKYWIPAEHIVGALREASASFKSKVGTGRKSMKDEVAGGYFVAGTDGSERLVLRFDEFLVDKRSAVNQNNKARVMVIRPKFKGWSADFILVVDNESALLETVKEIVIHAGQYKGIGSYRPTKGGPFGRFVVKKFVRG